MNILQLGSRSDDVNREIQNKAIALHFSMYRDLKGLEIYIKDRYSQGMSNYASDKPYFIKFNILTNSKNSYIENQF